MKLGRDTHLTYCLNVHPGETWEENFAALRGIVLAVRDLVSPGKPFGLGMRLSAAAASELHQPKAREAFKVFLIRENLYVFTINGFPFGRFHGGPVKENVYAPDWRSRERVEYTLRLAEILADLLPEDCIGTISTVPGSWKPWIRSATDVDSMVENLAICAESLARIRQATGREIVLALEPEPGCYLETTEETARFFTERLFTKGSATRRHLGVCLDTCHAAVEFEEPAASLRHYRANDIRVPKIQISSALRTRGWTEELEAFVEPVYLHQTIAITASGDRTFWPDLGGAIEALRGSNAREIRVHFHVPLDFSGSGDLHSTADSMTTEFFDLLAEGGSPHLEIETYTWDVLPEDLRAGSIEKSIAREFAWVTRRLSREGRR